MLEDIRLMTSLKRIIMKMLHIHKCKDGIMVKPPYSHNSDLTVVLFFFFLNSLYINHSLAEILQTEAHMSHLFTATYFCMYLL